MRCGRQCSRSSPELLRSCWLAFPDVLTGDPICRANHELNLLHILLHINAVIDDKMRKITARVDDEDRDLQASAGRPCMVMAGEAVSSEHACLVLSLRGSGCTSTMRAFSNVRQRVGGRHGAALAACMMLLCTDTAAAQTVIANSQLQTCVASGSVLIPTSHVVASAPARLHSALLSNVAGESCMCDLLVSQQPPVGRDRRWTRRWGARRSW